ncbi:MAG: hypothetical protein ACXWX4_08275 [Actinomycetota bacterium]
MQTGSSASERRCPDCAALASPDAEWCGQCFRSLVEPEPAPEPPSVVVAEAGAPSAEDARRAPTWPCPACGNENPLELDACAVCGTTFASLMRRDEAPATVDPADALRASLLFPGLGHRKVGRGLDGLARGVLFTVLAAMALTVLISGVRSAGALAVFALFFGAALLMYVGSAWEAYRLADGGRPFISSRALMWVTVVVIMTSVAVLAVSVVTAAKR